MESSEWKDWGDYAILQSGKRWESFKNYTMFCQRVRELGLPDEMMVFDMAHFSKEHSRIKNKWQNWRTFAYAPVKKKGEQNEIHKHRSMGL